MSIERINKALESINGISKASPNPYFTSKVLNRLALQSEKPSPGFSNALKLVMASIVVVIFVNAYLAYTYNDRLNSKDNFSEFIQDYNLEESVAFQENESSNEAY